MIKDYTYTTTIGLDFDDIIEMWQLDKSATVGACKVAVLKYTMGLDDAAYYLIDNEDEIAQDLYDYLQSK